jgi:hypothetical protein
MISGAVVHQIGHYPDGGSNASTMPGTLASKVPLCGGMVASYPAVWGSQLAEIPTTGAARGFPPMDPK